MKIDVLCPVCKTSNTIRYGMQPNGEQRFYCNNIDCNRTTFLISYSDKGRIPEIRRKVISMTMNSSGIRDISRVLGISTTTIINIIKSKEPFLSQVNYSYLDEVDIESLSVTFKKVDESQDDEMWSYVGNKSDQRWLWHAIDHKTGAVLAYILDRREDQAFIRLKKLLEPFGIDKFYTDSWGAYLRNLKPSENVQGKDKTWRIERKHLTFRTRIKRLARKTICFSRSKQMHDIVIGLFINRHEFGLLI